MQFSDFAQQADSIRTQTITKTKEGSFAVKGIFLHLQKPQAAAPGKRDPPRKFHVMLINMDTMIQHDGNGAYTIKDDAIVVGHIDNKAVDAAKEAMTKNTNDHTIAAVTEAEQPRAYSTLTNGKTLVMSTFAKGNLESLKFPQIVECLGVRGDYSLGNNGTEFISFSCTKVIPAPNGGMPFPIQLASMLDTNELRMPYPPVDVNYHPNFMLVGNTFNLEDPTLPISMRILKTSESEDGFVFRMGTDPAKPVLPLTIGQMEQDGGHWAVGTCYDADVLNRNFGITDLTTYSKILAANNKIPMFVSGSCDIKKTRQNEANGEAKRMAIYVNDIYTDLRRYLLTNGVPLSYDFCAKQLCNGKSTFVKRDNPQNFAN